MTLFLQIEILLECENFYKNLYTSKVDTNKNADAFFPPLEEQKRLNQEEQSLCEGPLSKKECLEANAWPLKKLQDQMAFPANLTRFSGMI